MKNLNPGCPICRGRGWYETGLYGLENDPQPCPSCNPVVAPTRAELLAVILAIASLLGLVAMGSWS